MSSTTIQRFRCTEKLRTFFENKTVLFGDDARVARSSVSVDLTRHQFKTRGVFVLSEGPLLSFYPCCGIAFNRGAGA